MHWRRFECSILVMRWEIHPTLQIGSLAQRPAGQSTPYLHMHLWISTRLEDWDAVCSAHLSYVISLAGARAGEPWQPVQLNRLPLAVAESSAALPDDLIEMLDAGLAGLELSVYRYPALGMVSILGESRHDFRSRVLGLLQPEVMKSLGGDNRTDRNEGRRGSGERDPRTRREGLARLAQGLFRTTRTLEEVSLSPLASHVVRADAGILLLPAGIAPSDLRDREMMISGNATAGRRK